MTVTPMGAGRRPRVGVVLGAGGVLGAAWTAGALGVLEQRLGRPLGTVELMVGTSAGSVLAAALRCGIGVEEIVRHQRGIATVGMAHLAELDRESGHGLPPLPRLRLGSPRLLRSAAVAPHRMHPLVAASALMPQGRAQHASLTRLVRGMLERAQGCLPSGQTWVMAVDYDSGRRVAFGRSGAPRATLPDAVVASCSIPGWYQPKVIAGRRYVDGGVRSMTSLDLLAGRGLDEVYVLAPMASYALDNPRNTYARIERGLRRLITVGLTQEARRVRDAGARLTVLTPGPEDLAAIGPNLMDPSRRLEVLETSLRTAPRTLVAVQNRHRAAAA